MGSPLDPSTLTVDQDQSNIVFFVQNRQTQVLGVPLAEVKLPAALTIDANEKDYENFEVSDNTVSNTD